MTHWSGDYYDGKTSRRQSVTVYVLGNRVEIVGDALRCAFDRSELQISERLGDTPRALTLPDGARVVTTDNEAVDRLLGDRPSARFVHWLEARWPMALAALILTLGTLWGGIAHGVPALAAYVAVRVPLETEQKLAGGALDTLDRTLFAPSELPEPRKAELRTRFEDVGRTLGIEGVRPVEFRSTDLGANAFAFPGGLVIVTDDLVKLAQHDDELVAVLAHELGHVQHRHALRHVLQNATAALVIAAVTGDITSSTALAAALPTLLVQAKYTRAFEREADQFALDSLRRLRIPPHRFADILLRLQQAHGGDDASLGYLDTHPATAERIRALTE
jgi:Zn-dependent protease with chaperone function